IGYAPQFVNWSFENLGQLIRIPKAVGISPRIELRSADAACNPYVAFKLILAAGIEGIKQNDCSLLDSTMKSNATGSFDSLPSSLEEAVAIAKESDFVSRTLSPEIRSNIFRNLDTEIQEYNLAKSKDEFEDKAYFKFI
ncbi:MAG TPA: glutamine synthetase, partial [Ruminococcus sp.]|nr:glutamine synthetase [Ruminococcus sp.]